MKTGYSNLLGEYVPASFLEYRDCEAFQIVCPACREPVFVCSRTDTGNRYLSHYKKDKVYPQDCELRVNSLKKADMDELNIVSRGQKLSLFLEVIKREVTALFLKDYTRSELNRQLARVRKAKAFKDFERLCVDFLRHGKDQLSFDLFDELAEGHIDDCLLAGDESILNTAFNILTVKRIVFDIYRQLLTKPSESNLTFLIRHGFLTVCNRLEATRQSRELLQHEAASMQFTAGLLLFPRKKMREFTSMMMRVPYIADDGTSNIPMFFKLLRDLNAEMLGILLRIPYLDILKRAAGAGNTGHESRSRG